MLICISRAIDGNLAGEVYFLDRDANFGLGPQLLGTLGIVCFLTIFDFATIPRVGPEWGDCDLGKILGIVLE